MVFIFQTYSVTI